MLSGTWELKNPLSGKVYESFTFHEDGTYEYWHPDHGSLNSTYTINGNTITNANGLTRRYELKGNKLYFDNEEFPLTKA